MKKTLVGGTLTALIILGSPALAPAGEQQPAVADNTVENGEHSKIWVKVDTPSAQEIPVVEKQQPAADAEARKAPEAEATPAEAAPVMHQDQQQQDTPEIKNLKKKLANAETTIQALQEKLRRSENISSDVEAMQQKITTAASTIQSLQDQLAASRQDAAQHVEDLQQKLTEAESTIQQLKEQALESTQTIEKLNQELAQIQSLTEQPLTITECDALRAQVTGFEIITQEQQQTIDKNLEEQNYWKINKDLLLSNIRELQDKLKMLKEKNRGLMRDLAAARK